MKARLFCPVCRMQFPTEEPEEGMVETCTICGAKVEVVSITPTIRTRKYPQAPKDEIVDRVNTFARLRDYVFSDQKGLVLSGLMKKKRQFGDFYCPCRIENDLDTICPCKETRQNQVQKEGSCRCGLFFRDMDAVSQAES